MATAAQDNCGCFWNEVVSSEEEHTPSLESQVLGWRRFQPCCTACSGWSNVIQAKADTGYSLIAAAECLFPEFSYLLAEAPSPPWRLGSASSPSKVQYPDSHRLCSPRNVVVFCAQQGFHCISSASPLDHSSRFTHRIHLLVNSEPSLSGAVLPQIMFVKGNT